MREKEEGESFSWARGSYWELLIVIVGAWSGCSAEGAAHPLARSPQKNWSAAAGWPWRLFLPEPYVEVGGSGASRVLQDGRESFLGGCVKWGCFLEPGCPGPCSQWGGAGRRFGVLESAADLSPA